MSKNAIILYYDGVTPPQALITRIVEHVIVACHAKAEYIIVKHYDEDAIAKAVGESAIRKIVSDANELAPTDKEESMVKVLFNVGSSKLQVVKFIKEHFGLSLKTAKEIADNGIITVPESTDVYSFVQGLYNCGGSIAVGCDDNYVMAQAAVFLNDKYPGNLQVEQFVKDFAMASYHDRVNATDEVEDAILGAVGVVKSNPELACKWISESLVKTITLL